MSADLFNAGVAIFSSFIGGFIGGGLTLMGVHWTLQEQKKEAKERDAAHINGLLQAFHAEIETLWGVYRAAPGARIVDLGNDEPMLVYWPLTLEYFTIYSTNAASIGKIRDHELRKQIIATYTKARSMFDSLRMNNELLQKWEHDQLLFQETQNPVHQSNANTRFKSLVEYAKVLKESHSELESMVFKLLHHLQRNPYDHPGSVAKF